MEKQELNQSVSACIANPCGIEVYLGLKNGEIRKANFISDILPQLRESFIEEVKNNIISAEASVLDYSSADDRGNAIYKYDLEMPAEMNIFADVLDAEKIIPLFSFDDDGVSNISFILIVIGTQNHYIVLYKKIAQINVYKKNSGLFVRRQDNEFVCFNDDFLRIIPGVDLFYVEDNLYVLNLSILEKEFNIHDAIITAARHQIDLIARVGILENPDVLIDSLSNISYARKLSKIADSSPVLGHIDNNKIVQFTKTHPILKKVLKFSEDGNKIKLSSQKSKLLFLKLINDDYLTSDLTSLYYDSLAKDSIPNENE